MISTRSAPPRRSARSFTWATDSSPVTRRARRSRRDRGERAEEQGRLAHAGLAAHEDEDSPGRGRRRGRGRARRPRSGCAPPPPPPRPRGGGAGAGTGPPSRRRPEPPRRASRTSRSRGSGRTSGRRCSRTRSRRTAGRAWPPGQARRGPDDDAAEPRPRPLVVAPDKTGADGVLEDVPIRRAEIFLVLDQLGAERSPNRWSRRPWRALNARGVARFKPWRRARSPKDAELDDEVVVIRHQAPAMEPEAASRRLGRGGA